MRGTLIAVWVTMLTSALVCCGGKADQGTAPGALDVDVTNSHGQVTPTNATLQAKVKQPIRWSAGSRPSSPWSTRSHTAGIC
ncbi:hypothetical protein [Mycobacterium tilburgii]|uniref:hypothetical protein n=1 Tax=Mycobacterium tilburgii TaxID=44467 RepID=UPI0016427E56